MYQCKHYDHHLSPGYVWTELGKLCVHTYRGDYSVPRKYRFVPPRGVGPKLYNLLNTVENLRAGLIANWEAHCRKEISEVHEFPLEGALKDYVEQFDFKIVWYLTPTEIVNQHQRTKYWHRQFKVDPPPRPDAPPPPAAVEDRVLPYIRRLLVRLPTNS